MKPSGIIAIGAVATAASLGLVYSLTRPGNDSPPSSQAPTLPAPQASPSAPNLAIAPPVTVYIDPTSSEFAQLIATDPATAAAALSQSADVDLHDRWLLDIMRSWLSRSPQQSIDWVSSLPAGDYKSAATEDLFYTWASIDPSDAAATLEQQLESNSPTPGLVPFVNAWALGDPNSTARWLDQLGEHAPTRALAALAGSWVARDPLAATAWVASLPPEQRANTTPRLAITWSNSDPAAALNWLHSQPGLSPEQTQRATLAALASWASSDDPTSAIDYASRIRDSPQKTEAVQTVAESLAESDPSAAVDLALTLSAPTAQSKTLSNIYNTWVTEDTTGDARLHLVATLATLPPESTARNALLDVLYHHDPPFREELLRRATK